MEKKVLFLDVDLDDFGDYFRNARNEIKNIDSKKLYKKIPDFFKKILLFLGTKINKSFLWMLYGDWKNEIEKYDYIIFPSRKSCSLAIDKAAKKTKVIIYYWNLITNKEISPNEVNREKVKMCTFDKGDAIKYNISFVDTYYFKTKIKSNNKLLSDVFYVGIIRPDRERILNKISKELSNTNFKLDFNIVKYNDFQKRLTYNDVVQRCLNTRVIIDLNRESQMGLTLRPLEALFFEKKLITNNKNIVDFAFYNKNNIFIIDVDDINGLKKFIESPYERIDDKIKDYYDFKNWIERVVKIW